MQSSIIPSEGVASSDGMAGLHHCRQGTRRNKQKGDRRRQDAKILSGQIALFGHVKKRHAVFEFSLEVLALAAMPIGTS